MVQWWLFSWYCSVVDIVQLFTCFGRLDQLIESNFFAIIGGHKRKGLFRPSRHLDRLAKSNDDDDVEEEELTHRFILGGDRVFHQIKIFSVIELGKSKSKQRVGEHL